MKLFNTLLRKIKYNLRYLFGVKITIPSEFKLFERRKTNYEKFINTYCKPSLEDEVNLNDSLKIFGNPNLNLNGNFYIKNYQKDHRVAMTAVIAALSFGGNWKIEDLKESIKTSFPNFLKIVKTLGAKIN